MPSERTQRQIDRLLDEAEQAIAQRDWNLVRQHAQDVLLLDADNEDARNFLTAAERGLAASSPASTPPAATPVPPAVAEGTAIPASFASGRYTVKRFLGEGGKKKVYLAHDTLLDRDVAFALIKTEGLDAVGRDRICREAQAMGRLGAHPHIVSVFDLGEEADGQPYIVTELMGGGDVEGIIEKAPEHRPELARTLEIGIATCRGLEFAHSHGIVHRDLKPGNVWLTADGTAKLGDFGLAVALDKTRLTQAGMMVGTVSYMPPEQAMGGEVTPRSDLYSLGAMLYEMVTGRPPFIGDESVAIITQHLNSAPVAPAWHNPTVPPLLETLILRLLEKDPAKRPASAMETQEALEAIQSSGRKPSAAQPETEAMTTPAAENPMYRRTFVGREQELRQLQNAYDAAVSGQGALAMVVGESGIGKTSLCEQLATYATIRGGKTLVGHCYEEGSLSLPYLPFVEALRSYVLAREPDDLRKDLGTGAGEVARIVSEIRDRVHVELPSVGAPEDDRWRLLQAVTGFLRNAATVQPLVIVLEDLHDADRGTLDFLLHLSRNLVGARLLVVGTYRDVEVDRAHPLSNALAELGRGATFRRIPLRGLTVDEVHRMMSQLRGPRVPWSRAEAIHRQTEGNPLFVQEVLRYLAEESAARGAGTADYVSTDAAIPEGLRDVLGRRLSRLSERSNQVLAVAAVIGREFRLDVLERVLSLPEEELTAALEEASATAIIETRVEPGLGVAFRFTHALFRQTLYQEIFSLRRIRLHQQIARALEAVYSRRLEEHAAELAEHFAQSTEHEDMEKALRYSELAARRAMAVYAYGDSVRHLEQALRVLEVLDPDNKTKRCDLLFALGDMLQAVGDSLRAAREVASAAFELAEALGEGARARRACEVALRALTRAGIVAGEYRQWVDRADRYASPETADRAEVDLAMATVLYDERRFRSAWERISAAQELARRLHDSERRYRAAALQASRSLLPAEPELRSLVAELTDLSREHVSPRMLNFFLWEAGCSLLSWGKRDEADRLFQELQDVAARTRYPSAVQRADLTQLLGSTLAGRWDEAFAQSEAFMVKAEGLGNPSWAWTNAGPGITRVRLALGENEAALAGVEGETPRAEAPTAIRAGLRALCLAALGRLDEARASSRPMLDPDWLGAEAEYAPTFLLVLILEISVLLQERDAAARLSAQLAGNSGQLVIRWTSATAVGRHLGAASALLGDQKQARYYYEQALEGASKIRFRPEIALTHLGIAELLLEDADKDQRSEALQHLDFAIAEFREMKMQPSLERALRRKEVLKA